ncbi:hypothetical protein I551_1538 [Mycobacterium ulcerans str. Harvey]|uniref:Uncharacterized protein n=1 Tax=Mycobacterium ulcerans str. Harvey TaxID=1299332 RepID=A0ABN0R4F5_MYCUL|nr:hypothetical protein I551_1538 [Mycobacterium ulcerans str. Harvey]
MTTALASDRRHENRAEQLESLRRQIAVLSGKPAGKAVEPSADPLAIPAGVAGVALPRGTVAVLSGPGHCC